MAVVKRRCAKSFGSGVVALLLVACGSNAPAPTTNSHSNQAGIWLIAAYRPAPFDLRQAEQRGDFFRVTYSPPPSPNDRLSPAQQWALAGHHFAVVTRPYGSLPPSPTDTPVVVAGHPGVLYHLGPDDEFDTIISWQYTATVGAEVDGSGIGPDVLLRIANSVQAVSGDDWQKLVTETSSEPDPQPSRHTIASNTVEGHRWMLVALVPHGFPLGPYDIRPMCVQFNADPAALQRSFSPACSEGSAILGQSVFVFGALPTDVAAVKVVNNGVNYPATLYRRPDGLTTTVYLANVPYGTCIGHVEVTWTDGSKSLLSVVTFPQPIPTAEMLTRCQPPLSKGGGAPTTSATHP